MAKTSTLQRFLKEPLLHFILIGGLFFLIYSGLNDPERDVGDTIVITPARIGQLGIQFKGIWNRMPTAAELDHLIEEEIRSEVYYRDALALGLNKNDAMVRRRLRQKMEFLTDTGIYLKEPTEQELNDYFTNHKQAYRKESLLAFEQVYLGRTPSQESVTKTLKTLLKTPAVATSSLGQRSRLPAQLGLSRPDAIDSIFGQGFYGQLPGLQPGEWDGPVKSSYGLHLVRTLNGQPGRIVPLVEIRDAVVKDWKSARALENREADYEKRRSRYTVEIIRDENTDTTGAKEKS